MKTSKQKEAPLHAARAEFFLQNFICKFPQNFTFSQEFLQRLDMDLEFLLVGRGYFMFLLLLEPFLMSF